MQPMPSTLPAVDAYISTSAPFAQPILEKIRATVHSAVPDAEEAIKWSMPFFIYKGIILANMAAFKAHCSFGIWSENVQPLMRKNPAEKDAAGGMGSFGKLQSLEELPSAQELKRVLVEAARKIDSGERSANWSRTAPKKRDAPEFPEAFERALKKNKTAATNLAAMSLSCQREYSDWITEAKREETREKRIATALEWISEGKSRNWKYQNC